MTDYGQVPPASTASLDRSMSVGIKREREEAPLFEPPEGLDDGGEGDQTAIQEQLTGETSSKRRKTGSIDTLSTPTTPADERGGSPAGTTAREAENPFTNFHLDTADLEASGGEVIGDLGFRQGYPKLAAYHYAFPVVEKKVTSICEFLIKCIDELRALGWSEKDIMPIYEEFRACRNPSDTYPTPGVAAFFGPTGKGKSSTMNSILNARSIAYEHSGSNRGTYITHMYMAASDSQPPGHVAKVYYLDERGVSVRLKTLCGHIINYLNFEADSKDEDQEDDDESDTGEDFSSHEQKYETALECLHNALCSEERFATQDKVAKYFRDLVKNGIKSKTTLDKQVRQLMDSLLPRIEALLDSRKRIDDVETIEAFDAQTFQRELKRCTRAARPKDLEASPWPFVTKVEIFLRNEVLKDGVVPADLPGVGDKNQRIVENAIRDLKRAGTVLVFAAHDDRLRVNKELAQHLRTCIEAGPIENIVLVLPKIDTMGLLKEDERDETTDEDRKETDAAETRRDDLESQLRSVRREKEEAERKEDAQFFKANARFKMVEAERAAADRAVRQAHIKVRCEQRKKDAASMLKNIDKGKLAPELKVFPISNDQYQLHLTPRDGEIPFLDPEATGIPALRRHMLTAAAKGKSDCLEHLCLQKLPLLLNGAHGVLTKSPLERKDLLRKIIVRTVNEGQSIATELQTSILEGYESTVTAAIEKAMDRWCGGALALVSKGGAWSKMHGGTFGAVCNREGFWKRRKTDTPYNFNRIIFEIVQDGMIEAFDDFGDTFRGIVEYFHTSSLKKKLTDLRNNLTEGKMVNLGTFEHFIKLTLADIQKDMDIKFKKLQQFIDRTRRNMTLLPSVLKDVGEDDKDEPDFMVQGGDENIIDDEDGDGEAKMSVKRHFVGAAMVKVYADCLSSTNANPDQGASSKSRRKANTIKKKAGRPSMHKQRLASMENSFNTKNSENVFRRMGALAGQRLEMHLEEWTTGCNQIVHGGLKKILTNFDKRFQKTEVKTEGDKEAVAIFLRALEKAGEVVKGELKELVMQFTSANKEDQARDLMRMSQEMSLQK